VTVTLRQALGNDARRVHELVDTLLDSEDSLIVLIDHRRAISFAEGFGFSPCQLELVTAEIERGVRDLAVRREPPTEVAMDETLAESFPASDPPAWNPGLARPLPVDGRDPALKP
jgi:hypothetical protein